MADEQHSLQTYVSDMLALERHVRVPFEAQTKDDDFTKYGDAGALVARALTLAQTHIDDLQQSLDGLGGHAGSPVKSAVAELEGFFAGAIDKMRKTKVSKALRDDYTALALCSAGYTMLQSTALALGDSSVASLAQRHLQDYAGLVIDIGQELPAVVLIELRDIGVNASESAIEPARQAAQNAWRGARGDGHGSNGGDSGSSYAGGLAGGSGYGSTSPSTTGGV